MRAPVYRQRDGLGDDAPADVVGDHVEEPTAVGAIMTGEVELACRRIVPRFVRTTEPRERLDQRAGARGIDHDCLRADGATANHEVAAGANGESGGRAR